VVVPSGNLHEGDVILLRDGDEVPADVVVVGSSGETDGSVYVQTANIDGEIDLKSRVSLELPACKQIVLHLPEPSSAVYSFDARLQVDGGDAWRSVGVENTLWAATHVRNVEWVLGLVVYCGNETKLGQNKRLPPTKWTVLERYVNKVVQVIVAVQLLLMLSLGASGYAWERRFLTDAWYLDAHGVGGVGAFVTYSVRFLLLSSLMIPISLKVTMDAFKFMSAKFIDWDLGCYDEASDAPADAISTSLAEDLGQVDHVFCDKTGTLTENVMRLDSVYCAGLVRPPLQLPFEREAGGGGGGGDEEDDGCRDLLLCLALCNTVIPDPDTGDLKASSPDEEALVVGAADAGCALTMRDRARITLNDELSYVERACLEFSSTRRRMSVIVRDEATGQHRLYLKGADAMVFPRLGPTQPYLTADEARSRCDEFATQGLRTLLIAVRLLTDDQVDAFLAALQEAKVAMDGRARLVEEAYASVETDLTLLGVTAIEDRLQEGVPEALELLVEAGCRVWMLTGDKKSTAIQIGVSCRMLQAQAPEVAAQADAALENYPEVAGLRQRRTTPPVARSASTLPSPVSSPTSHLLHIEGTTLLEVTECILSLLNRLPVTYSVVVEGSAIGLILASSDPLDRDAFASLCLEATTVICCRMSPQQKADVVRLVKERGRTTLAIGDGGNDVVMIQEAHVGVGIYGREGLQAARAADYAVARFRFLARLMLLHGRSAYRRLAFIAQYCCYKSMVIAVVQLLHALATGFSGASLLDTFSLSLYNVVFTGLPAVLYLLDADVSTHSLFACPQLYRLGPEARECNAATFAGWAVAAVYHGAVLYFGLAVPYMTSVHPENGRPRGLRAGGAAAYAGLLAIQTGLLLLQSNTLTLPNILVILGTFGAYWAAALGPATLLGLDVAQDAAELSTDPAFWLAAAVAVTAALAPLLALRAWRASFRPTLADKVRYLEHLPRSMSRSVLGTIGEEEEEGDASSLAGSSVLRRSSDDREEGIDRTPSASLDTTDTDHLPLLQDRYV
jgi:phospholipid-translocating ATPase